MQQYSLQSSAYTSSIPRDYRPTWLQARALFAYDATGETELSMREGDVISVLKVQCCKDQTDSAIATLDCVSTTRACVFALRATALRCVC